MSSITNTVPHQPWESYKCAIKHISGVYSTAPPPVSNTEPCDVRELVKVHAHITTALLLVVSHWALLYTAQLSQLTGKLQLSEIHAHNLLALQVPDTPCPPAHCSVPRAHSRLRPRSKVHRPSLQQETTLNNMKRAEPEV